MFIRKDSAADFADRLAGAHSRRLGSRVTATFDENAAKLAAFVAL
jgi:predicted nucleic-acid-binding protein